MTPKEFELLAKDLFADRLKKEFNCDIPVNHLQSFTSLSGNTYEIDLSYTIRLFEIDYLTLVECKYWDSSVTREKVGYFKSILDDLKAQKGIIVTTKGFQKGAIRYARSQNIGLIKITNDLYFDTYSHFNGAIDLLCKKINKGKIFNPNERFTSFGIFYPKTTPLKFITDHHGNDLANFLRKDFDPGTLDDERTEMSLYASEQLMNIPQNWYKDYILAETGGLNYKMMNEPDLRILNLKILLLKMQHNENNPVIPNDNSKQETSNKSILFTRQAKS